MVYYSMIINVMDIYITNLTTRVTTEVVALW